MAINDTVTRLPDNQVSLDADYLKYVKTEMYVVGQAVTWEAAEEWLLELAGSCFTRREDEFAKFLRELADQAKLKGQSFRKQHKEHQQKLLESDIDLSKGLNEK